MVRLSAGGAGDALSASTIIEAERSQIGHDLHDLLLPLIFASSANLQSVIDQVGDRPLSASDRERLTQARQWLQEAMTLGRNLLTQIYPPELEQLGWLAAAKETTSRICGDQCELVWKVDEDAPVGRPDWDRDVATAAYRVVIEAVRNAVRHGKADTVAIRCDRKRICIVDDGSGFDPDQVPPNHFGIRAMRGRATLVGKSLQVESSPGGPTTVTMTLADG
ncbi:hypothetical protein FYK55_03955 [Roseiconus nitratireducens]|uniref:Histidine kinase/HSP90-like ATPase domain-containing protein n=1 Tax=Roseiconus nitratireducens TaxID=2605748 RepID=A0A5M6DL43_9BACT|nr:ATP-binding protein [Roseiconus nitratireducens]KAA5546065.1 hypothetical protein FYK55_03955 [Roseiconus nitratireducens]